MDGRRLRDRTHRRGPVSARDDHPPGRCKAPGVHMWDEQYAAMCAEIDKLRDQVADFEAERALNTGPVTVTRAED